MGYMGQLNPGHKAMVRVVKLTSGTKAAITKARERRGS